MSEAATYRFSARLYLERTLASSRGRQRVIEPKDNETQYAVAITIY